MYTAYISYVLTIMVFILMLIILYLTFSFFFFNDPATTEIYTLSLHDALPISEGTYNAVQPKSRRLGPRTYMRCRMYPPVIGSSRCLTTKNGNDHTSPPSPS